MRVMHRYINGSRMRETVGHSVEFQIRYRLVHDETFIRIGLLLSSVLLHRLVYCTWKWIVGDDFIRCFITLVRFLYAHSFVLFFLTMASGIRNVAQVA